MKRRTIIARCIDCMAAFPLMPVPRPFVCLIFPTLQGYHYQAGCSPDPGKVKACHPRREIAKDHPFFRVGYRRANWRSKFTVSFTSLNIPSRAVDCLVVTASAYPGALPTVTLTTTLINDKLTVSPLLFWRLSNGGLYPKTPNSVRFVPKRAFFSYRRRVALDFTF